MKITIESTIKVIHLDINGTLVPARVWEGETESGVPVHCFVTRIAPTIEKNDPRQLEFETELREQRPPTPAVATYPLRMIL
jgi:hypothetical protein